MNRLCSVCLEHCSSLKKEAGMHNELDIPPDVEAHSMQCLLHGAATLSG